MKYLLFFSYYKIETKNLITILKFKFKKFEYKMNPLEKYFNRQRKKIKYKDLNT